MGSWKGSCKVSAQKELTLGYEDNQESIMTADNECSTTGRMKHDDVKYCFIQESITMGEIRVWYISTELNWADVLTKAIAPKKNKDDLEALIGSKQVKYVKSREV